MERKLWQALYDLIMTTDYPDPNADALFPDPVIALVYLWAVVHDRPTCWATVAAHWPADLRPRPLPSQATMSRRLRSGPVHRLLAAVLRRLRGATPTAWVKYLDAKPLPVGGWTKDPDARPGRGANGWIRGYKLHAIWGRGPVPLAYEVLPADRSEPTTARVLVPRLGGAGYLVGDSSFDSNPLHALAARRQHQVVAPPKKKNRALGHCRHTTERLHALEMLRRPFGQALYASRSAIERDFGHLTSFGGGLGPLPAWVRRLWRVRLWVQAKLLINAVRDQLRQSHVA